VHSWTIDGANVPAGDGALVIDVEYATASFDVAFTTSNCQGCAGGLQSATSSATVTVGAPALTDSPPVGTAYLTTSITLAGAVDEATTPTASVEACILSVTNAEPALDFLDVITLATSRADPNVIATTLRGRCLSGDAAVQSTALASLVSDNGGADFAAKLSSCLSGSNRLSAAAARRRSFSASATPPQEKSTPDPCEGVSCTSSNECVPQSCKAEFDTASDAYLGVCVNDAVLVDQSCDDGSDDTENDVCLADGECRGTIIDVDCVLSDAATTQACSDDTVSPAADSVPFLQIQTRTVDTEPRGGGAQCDSLSIETPCPAVACSISSYSAFGACDTCT